MNEVSLSLQSKKVEVFFSKNAMQRYPQPGEMTARFSEFMEASRERQAQPERNS